MQQMKRPSGIVTISILWLIGSILSVDVGLVVVSLDLKALPHLSDLNMNEWFRFGVPAELILGAFIVALAVIQFFTVYGLLARKAWSYKMGLTVLTLSIIIWSAYSALCAFAPSSLGLATPQYLLGVGLSIAWLAIVWSYLRKANVQQYLRDIPVSLPTI